MKLGAIDFLTKPITPEALRRVVAEVIAAPSTEPAPPPAPDRRGAGSRRITRQTAIAFDLARAKRALNRGQFAEAESRCSRESPRRDGTRTSAEAADCSSSRLHTASRNGRTRRDRTAILRDWFPGGTEPINRDADNRDRMTTDGARNARPGLDLFGLFFAMVAACDRL